MFTSTQFVARATRTYQEHIVPHNTTLTSKTVAHRLNNQLQQAQHTVTSAQLTQYTQHNNQDSMPSCVDWKLVPPPSTGLAANSSKPRTQPCCPCCSCNYTRWRQIHMMDKTMECKYTRWANTHDAPAAPANTHDGGL